MVPYGERPRVRTDCSVGLTLRENESCLKRNQSRAEVSDFAVCRRMNLLELMEKVQLGSER